MREFPGLWTERDAPLTLNNRFYLEAADAIYYPLPTSLMPINPFWTSPFPFRKGQLENTQPLLVLNLRVVLHQHDDREC